MLQLPDFCYAMNEVTKTLIIIKKGMSGYFPYNGYDGQPLPTTMDYVDSQNALLEVNEAQRKAMEHGSMFGWDKPIADPNFWQTKLDEKKKQDTIG